MTLQQQAAAVYKWGRRYPNVFPHWMKHAAELYRRDRVMRGVEEPRGFISTWRELLEWDSDNDPR